MYRWLGADAHTYWIVFLVVGFESWLQIAFKSGCGTDGFICSTVDERHCCGLVICLFSAANFCPPQCWLGWCNTIVVSLPSNRFVHVPHMWLMWFLLLLGCRGTALWFGVSNASAQQQRWQQRSLCHCSQRYGKLKHEALRELDSPSIDFTSTSVVECSSRMPRVRRFTASG